MGILKYSNGVGHLAMSLASLGVGVWLMTAGYSTYGLYIIGLVSSAWFVPGAAKQVAISTGLVVEKSASSSAASAASSAASATSSEHSASASQDSAASSQESAHPTPPVPLPQSKITNATVPIKKPPTAG